MCRVPDDLIHMGIVFSVSCFSFQVNVITDWMFVFLCGWTRIARFGFKNNYQKERVFFEWDSLVGRNVSTAPVGSKERIN